MALTLTVNPTLTPVLTLTDTRETPFYGALNECLRSENREDIKPFLPWMKLALSGMYRLPLQNVTVYRGVRGNFMGISYIYIYIYIRNIIIALQYIIALCVLLHIFNQAGCVG